MVKLIDAMVLWDSCMIRVIDHARQTPEDKERYRGFCSAGACYKTWARTTDSARASHVLALFNRIVEVDRFPAKQVHEAFLGIEEYAEFHDPCIHVDANPFWKAYWSFEGDRR